MAKRAPIPQEHASVNGQATREEIADVLNRAVKLFGGPGAVAERLGVSYRTVRYWTAGEVALPEPHAKALASMTTDLVGLITEFESAMVRAAAYHRGERLRRKRIARENYFKRFGRYPVPTRGGKTP